MNSVPKVIEESIAKWINTGVFSDCELYASRKGLPIIEHRAGESCETIANCLFDMASVTKIMSTTALMIHAVYEKKINLADRLVDWFKDAKKEVLQDKHDIKIQQMLDHTSGLLWHFPFYDHPTEDKLNQVLEQPLQTPAGAVRKYSDLNFILLGWILERAYQKPIHQLFQEKIAQPLGLKNTFYLVNNQALSDFYYIKTEICPNRKRLVQGEVDDLNCRYFNGSSGHAGLFSNAREVVTMGEHFLKSYLKTDGFFPHLEMRQFADHKSYPLGFNYKETPESAMGKYFSYHTIGHLGYTGTSLWIDLDQEIVVAFLTNRIFPSVDDIRIREVRPTIHNLILENL